jgi:hypothetical protein
MHCKNSEGNKDTETSIQRDHASDRNHIEQAANIAFNGSVGSSGYICSLSRKRSHEDTQCVRINSEGSMPETQYQQVCSLTSKLFDQCQIHGMHES